jgi:hypothetical protein
VRTAISAILLVLAVSSPAVEAGVINADPSNYRTLLGTLTPGDTLMLAPGTYPLLPLIRLNGTPQAWITIQGPTTGAPAVISVDPANPGCCNLIQLDSVSYVAIKNLRVDSALVVAIDGVNSRGGTHDILVENCTFVGQGSDQGTIAISTKGIAWNWVIRGNTIIEAGTGLYLGSSQGDLQFIGGLIEGNLVMDTIGYNMEIKWQLPYALPAGLDPEPHKTIIRNNVFIKTKPQSAWPPDFSAGPRPNVLVGGFPTSGPGSADLYEIYGNFFYENKDGESLFQGSGRVALHDNIFVGGSFRAMSLVNHDLPIRLAYVYNNTIYGHVAGIVVSGSQLEDSLVTGNLILADQGLSAPMQKDNLVDTVANAVNYVNQPSLVLGSMDFYPGPGRVKGPSLDMTRFTSQTHYNLDFNGTAKGAFEFRGAYAGEGTNPGWTLRAEKKVGGPGSPGGDTLAPSPPQRLRLLP